jgi:hypothetical protein
MLVWHIRPFYKNYTTWKTSQYDENEFSWKLPQSLSLSTWLIRKWIGMPGLVILAEFNCLFLNKWVWDHFAALRCLRVGVRIQDNLKKISPQTFENMPFIYKITICLVDDNFGLRENFKKWAHFPDEIQFRIQNSKQKLIAIYYLINHQLLDLSEIEIRVGGKQNRKIYSWKHLFCIRVVRN